MHAFILVAPEFVNSHGMYEVIRWILRSGGTVVGAKPIVVTPEKATRLYAKGAKRKQSPQKVINAKWLSLQQFALGDSLLLFLRGVNYSGDFQKMLAYDKGDSGAILKETEYFRKTSNLTNRCFSLVHTPDDEGCIEDELTALLGYLPYLDEAADSEGLSSHEINRIVCPFYDDAVLHGLYFEDLKFQVMLSCITRIYADLTIPLQNLRKSLRNITNSLLDDDKSDVLSNILLDSACHILKQSVHLSEIPLQYAETLDTIGLLKILTRCMTDKASHAEVSALQFRLAQFQLQVPSSVWHRWHVSIEFGEPC